jgi:hypothetical protein
MPHLLADSAGRTPAVYTPVTASILMQAADVGERHGRAAKAVEVMTGQPRAASHRAGTSMLHPAY